MLWWVPVELLSHGKAEIITTLTFSLTYFLIMAGNFQYSLPVGATNLQQPIFSAVADSPMIRGGLQTFSGSSLPTLGSAWLMPSGSILPVQSNAGNTNAFTYQLPETALWPGLYGTAGQTQIPRSAASYPTVYEWGVQGNPYRAAKVSAPCSVASLVQDMSNPPLHQLSNTSSLEHLYGQIQLPANARLVQIQPQATPLQVLQSQGHGQQVPVQDWRSIYLYNHDARGQVAPGEMYSTVSSSRVTTVPAKSQNEMVLVLKAIQPVSTQAAPADSLHHPVSAWSANPQDTKPECKVLDTPPETRLEPKTLPLQQVPNQQDDGVEKVSTEIPAEILDEFLLPPESQETPLFPLEIPDINELLAWFDPVESMSEDPHTEGLAGAREVRPSDSFNKMPARKCISTYHVEGKDPLAALLSAPAVEPLDGATLPTPGKWKTPENAAKLVQTSGPFAITPLVGSGLMIGSSGPRLSDPKMPGRRKSKLPAATPPVPPSQAPKRSGSDGKGLSTDKGLAPKKRKVEVAAGCEFSQYLCQGDRENCNPGASTSGTAGEAMPGQSLGNSLLLTPCSVLEQTVADIQKSSMTEPMGPAEVVTPDKGQQQKLGAHGNDKGKGAVPGKGKFKMPGGRGGKKIPQQEAQPSKVPRSHLEMQMLESIQVFHPLGKKLQPATPAPKPPAPPPSKAPASTPTVSPQIILGLKRRLEALANQRAKIPRPAPGGRKDRQTDTPQKDGQADIARKDGQIDTPRKEGQVFPPKRLFQIPGNPGHGAVPPSSSSTAPAQQHPPPPPPHSSTSPWHPSPSHSPMVARSNPLQELEVSLPITPEQRPEREAMKRKAQKERELAAQYMKIGRRQFLVERERDWALEAEWGYLSLIRR